MKKIFTIFLAIMCLSFSCSCVEAKKIKKSQLEMREIQTRFFDTSDTTKVMKAAVNTLQDSGFIIQEIEPTGCKIICDTFGNYFYQVSFLYFHLIHFLNV